MRGEDRVDLWAPRGRVYHRRLGPRTPLAGATHRKRCSQWQTAQCCGLDADSAA